MPVTDAEIAEFTSLWQEEYGVTLTPAEARREAAQLVNLFLLIAQPLPERPATKTVGAAALLLSHAP